MTGLRVRTNAGRPNWTRVFSRLRDENRGKVTVFYCGSRGLAKVKAAGFPGFPGQVLYFPGFPGIPRPFSFHKYPGREKEGLIIKP